jgi:hypothetical protein
MRTPRFTHPRRTLALILVPGGALAGISLAWLATVGGGSGRSAGRASLPPRSGALMAVTAVSERDAWAVGFAQGALRRATLIEHWDGRGWLRLPSPDPAGNCCYRGGGPFLDSVAATSGRDAWAVGVTGHYQSHGHIRSYGLIEHWNGTVWTRVPVPPLPNGFLAGVAATSARDAWAVGSYFRHPRDSYAAALVEHWDGRAWRQVPLPSLPRRHYGLVTLNAVAATSARDAWVVGGYYPNAGSGALIEHWDGKAWRQVPSHGPQRGFELYGVTAISARNAWAVGASSATGKTLIEHWDGKAWRQVPSPAHAADGELSSVTATPSCGAWAVGDTGTRYGSGSSATLVVRWNGTGWKWVPSPSPGGYTGFDGVAEASRCRPWAVGGADVQTLIERWNGTAWKLAPRPR